MGSCPQLTCKSPQPSGVVSQGVALPALNMSLTAARLPIRTRSNISACSGTMQGKRALHLTENRPPVGEWRLEMQKTENPPRRCPQLTYAWHPKPRSLPPPGRSCAVYTGCASAHVFFSTGPDQNAKLPRLALRQSHVLARTDTGSA